MIAYTPLFAACCSALCLSCGSQEIAADGPGDFEVSAPAMAPAQERPAVGPQTLASAESRDKVPPCQSCADVPAAGYSMRLASANDAIVMTSDEAHAGAGFVSLSIHGSPNLVQAVDRGQGIQASVRLDRTEGNTQGYNPTVQGSHADGARGASSSVSLLRQAARTGSFVRSVTQAAFWMRPGAAGARNRQLLSDFIFDIRATADWAGNSNVVRWDLTLLVPSMPEVQAQSLLTVEVVTLYLKTSVFTVAEDYDVTSATLSEIPASHMLPSGPVFRSNPILVSSADGSRSVGLLMVSTSPVPRGYRVIDFRASGKNVIVPDYQWEQRYEGGVPAGAQSFEGFIAAGTKAEVLAAFGQLRTSKRRVLQ